MAGFIELLKKSQEDPESFKAILADKTKLADYSLTSDELNALKKADPAILKGIASGVLKNELASSQACQACADRTRLKEIL